MTVVISDTSPLNYLILIGETGSLPALYSKILIPDAVLAELRDAESPPIVAAWASMLPDWVDVALTSVEDCDSSFPDLGELRTLQVA